MYDDNEKNISGDIGNDSNNSDMSSQGGKETQSQESNQETTSGPNLAEIEKLIDTKIGLLYDKLITNATSSQEPNTEIEKEPDNYE